MNSNRSHNYIRLDIARRITMRFSIIAVAAAIATPSANAFTNAPFLSVRANTGPTAITATKNVRRAGRDSWRSTLLLSSVGGDDLAEISAAVADADEDGVETTRTVEGASSSSAESTNDNDNEVKLVLEPVPPASYTVTSSSSAPGGGDTHTLTLHLGKPGHPEPIVIETGKIGRQASAAVTLTRGDSVLYATACRDKDVRDVDFLPLSVDHQERFSSAGLTSGAFNKRDGRPAEHEILVCRLIDRPLRPLIADGWRHDTQLLSWVLSYDGVRTCDPLAITASAAALWLSDVPLSKPVAAAMVGYVDGQLVLNPT